MTPHKVFPPFLPSIGFLYKQFKISKLISTIVTEMEGTNDSEEDEEKGWLLPYVMILKLWCAEII